MKKGSLEGYIKIFKRKLETIIIAKVAVCGLPMCEDEGAQVSVFF